MARSVDVTRLDGVFMAWCDRTIRWDHLCAACRAREAATRVSESEVRAGGPGAMRRARPVIARQAQQQKNRGVLGERPRRGAPLEISDSGASSVRSEGT